MGGPDFLSVLAPFVLVLLCRIMFRAAFRYDAAPRRTGDGAQRAGRYPGSSPGRRQPGGARCGAGRVRPARGAAPGAIGADLGGNATAIGASANVVVLGIAERAGHRISFWGFTKYGLIVTAISVALAVPYLWLRFFAF